ncbi:MAG: DoxX family protein [Candidatus Kapaibacterium sp.]
MNSNRLAQIAYTLLRIAAGVIFLQAGGMILFGWFGGMPGAAGASPNLMSQVGIGAILEFFGGIAILLGLCTRPIAFILSGEMAVAYWQFHVFTKESAGAWPIQNHGEPAVLLCFIFLYMAAVGGGPWSLDALFRRKGNVTADAAKR